MKNVFVRREKKTHKGTYGKALMVAGSPGMAGAAVLAARAAIRSGVGLLRVSIDEQLFVIVQTSVAEATCVDRRLAFIDEYDAVGIGPGLGTDMDIANILKYKGKLILDADALNIVAMRNIDLRKCGADKVITPHPGEAARLLCISTKDVNDDRIGCARRLAKMSGGVAVLKGHETVIATPQGEVTLNKTGNPGMATGGSGDVLTGIITSIAAQGNSVLDAALAGTYVHGVAGDLAAIQKGEYGLTANDIIDYLPQAIMKIGEEQ